MFYINTKYLLSVINNDLYDKKKKLMAIKGKH
jgi:hypothetical protein